MTLIGLCRPFLPLLSVKGERRPVLHVIITLTLSGSSFSWKSIKAVVCSVLRSQKYTLNAEVPTTADMWYRVTIEDFPDVENSQEFNFKLFHPALVSVKLTRQNLELASRYSASRAY